jgi:hypothetical protein
MNTGEKEYIIIDNCVSIINDSSSSDPFEDEVLRSNRNAQTFFCSEKDTSTEGKNPLEQRGGTLIAPSVKEDWQDVPEQDNNHSGTARETEHPVDNGGGGADGGGMVDVDKTLERFIERTRTTLRDSSVSRYKSIFREFARASDLTRYTRRQLAGPTGKRLILAFITDKPRGYWRFVLAALKTVWLYGLDMPWPVDMRRDIGRLPKTLRGQSPPDDLVKQWADAMRNEKDPYLKLVWLLIVQHGWRPSHLAHIKWRNIRYDAQGRPIAIVANGSQEGFKTEAPIAVRLAPEVQEALILWSQLEVVTRNLDPERLVVPRRFHGGRLVFTEVSTQT